MKKDLGVLILLGVALLFSLYLIISGLLGGETTNTSSNEVLEQDLQISTANINLEVGGEEQIVATIIPDNATYKNLYWESANNNIVTVDNGLVKANSPGKTVIKVSTEKRKITKIINVTVKDPVIYIEEIKVNEPNIEIEVGDTKKIDYEITPDNATDKKVSFSTSDKNIVGFNQEGLLIGVTAGTATITLKSNNDKTATINITVKDKKIDVTKVTLNKKSITLEIGKSQTLTAKVSPTNATNKNVTWASSNEKIATVSNGKVTAKKAGSAKITVKTEDGEKTATCTVTVKEKEAATAKPIVPSSSIYKYEGTTLKYYVTKTNRYYLTYIWMQDPYNQIRKLEANTAKYGKVLKDSEITGNYKLNRSNVGEMMSGYISHNIIPTSKAAIGYNASGFYVQGAWNPPSAYYNNRSSSWFVLHDGIITRNRTDDNTNTNSLMVGIDKNGNLKVYDGGVSKAERQAFNKVIAADGTKNTWSFAPEIVKDGKQKIWGSSETAKRQGICQVNSNNYIMMTVIGSMKIDDVGATFASLGCKSGFNLDGGGSTQMFIKNPGSSTVNKIVCSDGSSHTSCRSIVEGIYFTEK